MHRNKINTQHPQGFADRYINMPHLTSELLRVFIFMARKESFITIQGWMATELKLSGNDLLVYALIYGFSQDGESEFRGSINYICGWLNCSRPTASKALSNLVEKGLISKRVKVENNMTFNRYKVILEGVKNLYGGSKETLQGGSKETLHHNIVLDNIKDNFNHKTCSEESFTQELIPYVKEYGKETIRAFFNYWTEKDNKGKMRVNGETFFEIPKRLATWSKNSFGKPKNNVPASNLLPENPTGQELTDICKEYGIVMPDHILNKMFEYRVEYVRQVLVAKTKGNASNFS